MARYRLFSPSSSVASARDSYLSRSWLSLSVSRRCFMCSRNSRVPLRRQDPLDQSLQHKPVDAFHGQIGGRADARRGADFAVAPVVAVAAALSGGRAHRAVAGIASEARIARRRGGVTALRAPWSQGAPGPGPSLLHRLIGRNELQHDPRELTLSSIVSIPLVGPLRPVNRGRLCDIDNGPRREAAGHMGGRSLGR
jgi:hypothetical protein